MKKPWQFNLRTLMVFTFKLAVLTALVRYGLVRPYLLEAERREREIPLNIAGQVIRRQQVAIPVRASLEPDEHARSNQSGWHFVSRCKKDPTDSQYLWNLELKGTSDSNVVKALNNGGIHNERFLQELVDEYRRLGWVLQIGTNEVMPASH